MPQIGVWVESSVRRQARSQDFEGEVSAGGAHAHCICAHAHCLDVTPPLQIACTYMKLYEVYMACIHKINVYLVCSVAKDVCQRHSTRWVRLNICQDLTPPPLFPILLFRGEAII